jgi:hypothetical protein
MGYCGLGSVYSSDTASDMYANILNGMWEELKLGYGFNREGNEYNTPGCVNVCLILEAGTFDGALDRNEEENLTFLGQIQEEIESLIKMYKNKKLFTDEKNRIYHLQNYKRMLQSLNKRIKIMAKNMNT